MTYELVTTEYAQTCMQGMVKKHGEKFRKQLKKALTFLAENPSHPGLHVHAIRNWPGWKEAYINKSDRLIYTTEKHRVIIAWCGSHAHLDQQRFERGILVALDAQKIR